MTAAAPICPYCNTPTLLRTGDVVYPHRPDLNSKLFWVCSPCDARVGCHPGKSEPLGSPANAALRSLRMQCHEKFDAFWKSGKMSRSRAYRRLASDLKVSEIHIGSSDESTCKRILQAVSSW